jgi:CheY-like chemotaxis protein
MTNDPERLDDARVQEMTDEYANDIVTSVLGLSPAELDDVYRGETDDDAAHRLYELSLCAVAEYQRQGKPIPPHVRAVLATVSQAELPLDGPPFENMMPQILLVDTNPARLLNRREIFEAQRFRVHAAVTLTEATNKLGTTTLQAVIVDWNPTSPQETEDLRKLQEWNLQVPIINVAVWAGLMGSNERHVTRNLVRALNRAFGKPMPRKLPERKPPGAQAPDASSSDLFNMRS